MNLLPPTQASTAPAAANLTVRIRPTAILAVLIVVSAAICGGYALLEYGRWSGTARLRYALMPWAEGSLGAWFGGLMLAMIALAALLKGLALHRSRLPGARAYLVVALGFLVLSADEVAALHEMVAMGLYTRLAHRLDLAVGEPQRYELFVYAAYGFAGILSFILLRRDYLALWRTGAGNPSLLLGAAILAGAIGVDALPVPWGWRHYVGSLEELLEMTGAAFLLHGMLAKLLPHLTLAAAEESSETAATAFSPRT